MKKLFWFILFTYCSLTAQQGHWDVIGFMPRPVAGGKTFVNNENIYILGGYSDSTQSYVDWIQKYSTFLFTWKLNTYMNEVRYGLAAGVVEDTTYYFGGVHSIDTSSSTFESWNVSLSPQIIDYSNYFKRIFSTGLIYGNNFYIIGGNSYLGSSPGQPYILEYNVLTSQFTYQSQLNDVLEDLPEQQMSALLGNNIYIFGGVTIGISRKIHKFSTTGHTLEENIFDLLTPRAGGESVYFEPEDKIFIIGGYNEGSNALNSVEIFSDSGGVYSIKSGPPLNYARTNFMSAVVNSEIYVLGGYDESGNLVAAIEKYISPITGVNDDDLSINNYELYQNYPNPFNPVTSIKYRIPGCSAASSTGERALYNFVTLKVYDIVGREVAVLVNELKSPGIYEVEFYAGNDGNILTSGIYIYRLEVTSSNNGKKYFSDTKKMVLLK